MLNGLERLSDGHRPGPEVHDLVLGVKSDGWNDDQHKRDQIMFNLLHRLFCWYLVFNDLYDIRQYIHS